MKITDYEDHLDSKSRFWFCVKIGDLPEQEFTPHISEILESEMWHQEIDDYGNDTVILDTGQDIVTWPNSERMTRQRKIILTYQEYINDHMGPDVLKRFLEYSFKEKTYEKPI